MNAAKSREVSDEACLPGGSRSRAVSAPAVSAFVQAGAGPVGEAGHPAVAGTGVVGSAVSAAGYGGATARLWHRRGVSEPWGRWQRFFREDETPFFERFERCLDVGWEHTCGGAKQTRPGLLTPGR